MTDTDSAIDRYDAALQTLRAAEENVYTMIHQVQSFARQFSFQSDWSKLSIAGDEPSLIPGRYYVALPSAEDISGAIAAVNAASDEASAAYRELPAAVAKHIGSQTGIRLRPDPR